jgi:hypothetical protein
LQRIAGGENHHRHGGTGHAGAAQAAGQLQPIHVRQADADDGGTERPGAQHLFGALATAHPIHRTAGVGEPPLDAAGHHGIVFDQQQAHVSAPRRCAQSKADGTGAAKASATVELALPGHWWRPPGG